MARTWIPKLVKEFWRDLLSFTLEIDTIHGDPTKTNISYRLAAMYEKYYINEICDSDYDAAIVLTLFLSILSEKMSSSIDIVSETSNFHNIANSSLK